LKDQATRDKERRHLDRLETLIDSIYALVIVLLVAPVIALFVRRHR